MARYYVEYERGGLEKWCIMEAENATEEQDKRDITYTAKVWGAKVLRIEKLITI